MCPTSSSEATGLLRRRASLRGAVGVEFAFTGPGVDVAEQPDRPGAVQAALAELETEIAVPVARMRQVHGVHVHRVTKDAAGNVDEVVPEADALVTTEPGVALMTRSADCVPVLLAAVDGSVVGALHAGRVGFASGVVPATVEAMRALGAEGLVALVGPAVCGSCYEVSAEMRDDVTANEPASYAMTSWGTPALDVPAGVVAQLDAAGVQVENVDICTYEQADTWSYRRQGPAAGRMGALVWRVP